MRTHILLAEVVTEPSCFLSGFSRDHFLHTRTIWQTVALKLSFEGTLHGQTLKVSELV